MGDLPEGRLQAESPPFRYVGIDYFGPLFVKQARSTVKRYGVIFTCLTCRAVHLEIAHSLDTNSFLSAFRRFVSRRGTPIKAYSDNGTNLKGGERELRLSIKELNQSLIEKQLHQNGIQWHFNPPTASHMGGVWERLIRSTRKLLKSLVNEQLLKDEALLTVMAEVEQIINDRPLTSLSDDPRDPEPLTPSKLLLLRNNSCVPPGLFSNTDNYTHRWWRQAQYVANVFWRRWLREYIPALQERQKWLRQRCNFKAGDLVLLVTENTPRGKWPLGLVTDVFPGRDGLVRAVTVKVGSTHKTRPITSLCQLEQSRSTQS